MAVDPSVVVLTLAVDRTGAFVHCLVPPLDQTSSSPGDTTDDSEMMSAGFTFRDDCGYLGIGRAGSIPFVSEIPGVCLAQFSLNNVHKRGLKHHHFISFLCIGETGRVWPVVVSGVCAMEIWITNIF